MCEGHSPVRVEWGVCTQRPRPREPRPLQSRLQSLDSQRVSNSHCFPTGDDSQTLDLWWQYSIPTRGWPSWSSPRGSEGLPSSPRRLCSEAQRGQSRKRVPWHCRMPTSTSRQTSTTRPGSSQSRSGPLSLLPRTLSIANAQRSSSPEWAKWSRVQWEESPAPSQDATRSRAANSFRELEHWEDERRPFVIWNFHKAWFNI